MTVYDGFLFQMGTYPALTASPIVYQLVNAAELAAVGSINFEVEGGQVFIFSQ